MILYHSNITRSIFSHIEKRNDILVEDILWKKIYSNTFLENILNSAKNLQSSLKQGDKIVILLRDSILFSELIIASLLNNCEIILLEPSMGRNVIIQKIKKSKVTHIITEGFLYDIFYFTRSEILKLGIIFILHGFTFTGMKKLQIKHIFRRNVFPHEFQNIDEEKNAITVFTGGTTWDPKWVVHSFGSIFCMLEKIKLFISGTQVFYADMPHFLLLWILAWGKIITGPYNLSPKKLSNILEKYKVDTYFSPPYKYNYFIENNLSIPKNLKNILLWSAPIYIWFLKKLIPLLDDTQKITCIYGMTEILPIAYIDGRKKVQEKVSGDLLWNLIDDIHYKILEDGELIVNWVHQMSHYLFEKKEQYIYTGDLVKIERDMLIMIGRKKDMIIRKEYNIYPWLYEPIISKIPWVVACALIWIYDKIKNDEKIILYIEESWTHNRYDANSILKILKTGEYSIDDYALPDEVFFTKIPRNGRQQKIDKNILRWLYIQKEKNIWK